MNANDIPMTYWASRYAGHSQLGRVLNKIDYRDPNGCWIWTGARTDAGYGTKGIGRRSRLAHRLIFELYYGPVPAGLSLDHLCRVTRCVNPEHLEPVTHRENVMRGESPPSANAHLTHCASGHAYDEANTRITTTGYRVCRTCHRLRERQRVRAAR